MDSLDRTYRAATSKGAQRAFINVSLLVGGCIPLLFLATVATTLFYRSYLPDQIIATPVYLQYGSGRHPFGVSSLANSNLKTQQAYDITVALNMPRSPANTKLGNFMVVVYLLNVDAEIAISVEPLDDPEPKSKVNEQSILFKSRRPALVPYRDPWVTAASRLVLLFYHLVVPESQTMTLNVPMADRVRLASHQSAMPTSAYLEIEAGQELQTYEASIIMTAQLHGLRWIMYHYRLITFVTATVLFWAAEVAFMMVAWLAWGSSTAGGPTQSNRNDDDDEKAEAARVKVERDEEGFGELSDVPRTFPTSSKQPPLRYEPSHGVGTPEVKSEEVTIGEVEADDEADEETQEGWRGDSGIGTSYSEAGTGSGGKSIRRRSSNRRKV